MSTRDHEWEAPTERDLERLRSELEALPGHPARCTREADAGFPESELEFEDAREPFTSLFSDTVVIQTGEVTLEATAGSSASTK